MVENTRDHYSYKRESGGVYDTILMRDLKKKGNPIPDSVSAYIKRWFLWGNSNYVQEKITI
ncbi:MAG: hypothetical protein GY756_14790 [bacterium]|nr:hypothetical protein [bacterium]